SADLACRLVLYACCLVRSAINSLPPLHQTPRVWRVPDLRHRQQATASDLLDHVLGRHHRTLLPARQLRHLIADDTETPIRRQQPSISLRVVGAVRVPVGPTAALARNILPRNRDRLV